MRPPNPWDLAGLQLQRSALRLTPASSPPQEILVDGEGFWWNFESCAYEPVDLSQANVLEDFIALADAEDEGVLSFVRKWGTLQLCRQHGEIRCPNQASSHPVLRLFQRDKKRKAGPPVLGDECPRFELGWSWEPFSGYRRYARMAKALINMAADIYRGQPAARADCVVWLNTSRVPCNWDGDSDFFYFFYFGECKNTADAIELSQWLLQGFVDDWIQLAGVRPALSWQTNTPYIEFGNPDCWNVFSALVTRLLLAISRSDALALCFGCGRSYVPLTSQSSRVRRPSKGHRSYCLDCRQRGVPDRDAKRRQREREARMLELAGEGKSVAEIAAAVELSPEKVEAWLARRQAQEPRKGNSRVKTRAKRR